MASSVVPARTTVYVGMSGGVDSSVSAALLQEQGYQVVGVYMKNWTENLPGMRCPWAEDLADAKRVAVQLGIPLRVYDFQREYRQLVVDYMIREYRAGRTPNPDIMCNQFVKFKLFLETACADGADMIATGHYASTANGRLYRAVDTVKDQTYFLCRVDAHALEKTIFPLSAYTKKDARAYAEQRGLVTAQKKDSQGICFVGSIGIRDFLQEFVTVTPGDIIDVDTQMVIGRHDGAILYTIGQRHGLEVGGGMPYYVTNKDMLKNEVYVSRNLNHVSMWRKTIELGDMHWIHDLPKRHHDIRVRMRHRGTLLPARLEGTCLVMQELERAVSPGQSAVIYDGDEVLGCGIVIS